MLESPLCYSYIALPNFAVCSRAVHRGILISLSQLVLQQYVGIVCALALQPFPLPLGKSRAHLAKIPTQSRRSSIYDQVLSHFVDESVSASR